MVHCRALVGDTCRCQHAPRWIHPSAGRWSKIEKLVKELFDAFQIPRALVEILGKVQVVSENQIHSSTGQPSVSTAHDALHTHQLHCKHTCIVVK